MKQSIQNALENLLNVIALEIININQENEGSVGTKEREELFEDLAPELIVMAANITLMQNGIGDEKVAIDLSFTTDEGMGYSLKTTKH